MIGRGLAKLFKWVYLGTTQLVNSYIGQCFRLSLDGSLKYVVKSKGLFSSKQMFSTLVAFWNSQGSISQMWVNPRLSAPEIRFY